MFATLFLLWSAVGRADQQVQYEGGPVLSDAQIYAVYWGPSFDPKFSAQMTGFLTEFSNSNYWDFLSQYNTPQQVIHPPTFRGSVTIQPKFDKTTIDDMDIKKELDQQIAANALPVPNSNTVFAIFFPKGTINTVAGLSSCAYFLAYHYNNGYQDVPYRFPVRYIVMPSQDCGKPEASPLTELDHYTTSFSHELSETITDPFDSLDDFSHFPEAWVTKDGSEIGDLCVDFNGKLQAKDHTYLVQQEWDNAGSQCTKKDYKTFASSKQKQY